MEKNNRAEHARAQAEIIVLRRSKASGGPDTSKMKKKLAQTKRDLSEALQQLEKTLEQFNEEKKKTRHFKEQLGQAREDVLGFEKQIQDQHNLWSKSDDLEDEIQEIKIEKENMEEEVVRLKKQIKQLRTSKNGGTSDAIQRNIFLEEQLAKEQKKNLSAEKKTKIKT
eukprot:UN23139